MNSIVRRSGEKSFYSIAPDPLYVFKEVPPDAEIHIPELSSNRKCTNLWCLVIFVLMLLLWLIVAICAVYGSPIDPLLRPADKCGNICGKKNVHVVNKDNCVAMDYSDYPIGIYATLKDRLTQPLACVDEKSCKNAALIFNRCYNPKDFSLHALVATFFYILMDLYVQSLAPIIILALFTIGASLLVLVAFRFKTLETIIVCAVLLTILFAVIMAYLGYWAFFQKESKKTSNQLAFFIIAVIGLVIVIYYWYLLFKTRKLLECLFGEASKAIFHEKLSLLLPSMCFFLLAVDLTCFYLLVLVTADPREKTQTPRIIFYVLTIIMPIWYTGFIEGLLCMVAAGISASYFFTRNKSDLKGSLGTSLKITFCYHMGTIAAGSLIITLLKIAKKITQMAKDNDSDNLLVCCLLCLCVCLLECLEELFEYLCRKAYIMTALHGKGLYVSGKRGARLIWHFLLDAVLMDGFVFSILFIVTLAITLAGMGLSIPLMTRFITIGPEWTEYGSKFFFKILFALMPTYVVYTIVYFFMEMLSVAAETQFLCVCEDLFLNDGSKHRPYFMSQDFKDALLIHIEDAQQKVLKKNERRESRGQSRSGSVY